jgi:hypothetical protein
MLRAGSPNGVTQHRFTIPHLFSLAASDMQIISAIFQGEMITAGFGEISAKKCFHG